MSRKPIHVKIQAGRGDGDDPDHDGVAPDRFREALADYAAGVTIVAVRDAGSVYGTTVSAFVSVSAEPPLVAVTLGPGAQVLPFLEEGKVFAVNVLSREQRKLASVFADSFPVGRSPFAEDGAPVIPGSLVALTCSVTAVVPVAASRLVVARVDDVEQGAAGEPLVYFRREYHGLD